jgi:hypothetical protein
MHAPEDDAAVFTQELQQTFSHTVVSFLGF